LAPVDGGNAPANPLFNGTAELIDLFAQDEELWVVDGQNAFHLSAKDGSMLHAFMAARPLLAAAFDGTHLVVADGAKMTTLKAGDLSNVAEGNMIEPCASAVLLSAHRFVCGPGNDWDREVRAADRGGPAPRTSRAQIEDLAEVLRNDCLVRCARAERHEPPHGTAGALAAGGAGSDTRRLPFVPAMSLWRVGKNVQALASPSA
jgi:hypothetical protein